MSKAFYYKGKQYRFLMKSQQLIFFLGLCLVKKPKHHAFRYYLFVAANTKRIYASIIHAGFDVISYNIAKYEIDFEA
jgi:hypothetical protein